MFGDLKDCQQIYNFRNKWQKNKHINSITNKYVECGETFAIYYRLPYFLQYFLSVTASKAKLACINRC